MLTQDHLVLDKNNCTVSLDGGKPVPVGKGINFPLLRVLVEAKGPHLTPKLQQALKARGHDVNIQAIYTSMFRLRNDVLSPLGINEWLLFPNI